MRNKNFIVSFIAWVIRPAIKQVMEENYSISEMSANMKNNTDKVKLDNLDLLRTYLDRNIASVRGLVRASQKAWGLESNVTD